MTSLTGKTIRWSFVDDPMPATTYEHFLHENGRVTWRILDGEYKGATRTEKLYASVRINETTWAISYLSASGHTLTVILNFEDGQAIAFGSNDKSWHLLHGTFEVVNQPSE